MNPNAKTCFPLNQLELCPLLRFQPPDKDCAAEHEVDAHADRHADHAPAEPQTEQRRKEKPCGDGQRDGDDHGELHVTGSAQSVAQRTGKGVSQPIEDIIDEHQPDHKFFGFR